jgi:hypothetical protein
VHERDAIGPWIKIVCTLVVAVIASIYWVHHGPDNYLWFSDLALFSIVAAMWLRSPLLVSMAAVGVLVFEIIWNVDLLALIITGRSITGGTQYMVDPAIPAFVRALSLFHIALPPVLVWLLYQWGYDRRALAAQTIVAWIVLPLSYFLTDPVDNINWAFGPGAMKWHWLPDDGAYLGLLMATIPVAVYLPTHIVLGAIFRDRA